MVWYGPAMRWSCYLINFKQLLFCNDSRVLRNFNWPVSQLNDHLEGKNCCLFILALNSLRFRFIFEYTFFEPVIFFNFNLIEFMYPLQKSKIMSKFSFVRNLYDISSITYLFFLNKYIQFGNYNR